jgi:hypothetical protein
MTTANTLDRRLYAGLLIISLVTLMYEILLTRVFSVTMGYHFAFVAISLALFGMTVGAVLVYLNPARFRAERAPREMAVYAAGFAATIVFSFLTHLSVPFVSERSVAGLYSLALTYTVLSVPFIFSGVCASLALTRFPAHVGRLYAADLAGAALGCVLLIVTLNATDGPTAVLVAATLAGAGAWLFAGAAGARRVRRAAALGTLALALFTALNAFTAANQFPLLRLIWVRGQLEERPLYERWNSFSRITIRGDPDVPTAPLGWGLSATVPPDVKIRQLGIAIDSGAETVLTAFDGNLEPVDFLQHDVTNLAHYLRSNADVLIVGTGGGRDVLSALVFKQQRVVGVEINDQIIGAVNGRFGDFTGHLDRLPNVTFVNDEARSYVARTNERFDIIQVSLVDTWAATASGAFVLTENSLYTVEAWENFLNHLRPNGVLTFSRWYIVDNPTEMYRLTNLAVTALARQGVADPRAHIVIVHYHQPQNEQNSAADIGTMLISASPFSDADLNTLEDVVRRNQFSIALSPRSAEDETFARIASGRDLGPFVDAYPANISAPTDDSPFFFLTLRLRDALNADVWGSEVVNPAAKAISVLGGLLIVVVALTLLSIVVPLTFTTERGVLRGAQPLFAFFCGIGLGFMLVEVSQTQRLIVFLGHPTYSLSVVLFTLLLASGLGSYSTQHTRAEDTRGVVTRLGILLALLAVFGLSTPVIVSALAGATTPVRIAAAIAMLFPPGLFMGMAFPLGMKLASAQRPALTPWLWGINGATSVCASVFAVVIAIGAGISTAFWTGCACYAVALAAYAWSARPLRPPATPLGDAGRTQAG